MARPFSERVVGDDWRQDAESWIHDQVEQHGDAVTGPIEQPRVRPWSTQLTVPTGAGRLWFKANARALAFEPAVQLELAHLAPDAVDAPYAIDAGRGWMLTRDRGATLRETREPTVEDWQRVVVEVARIQQAAAPQRERLLAVGLPDYSPATVLDRFDRVVEIFSRHPADHPAHVDVDLKRRLIEARPAIADAVEVLSLSALPSTWQHGDVHPNNVFALGDGSMRVFDFGDGQWAHAVEALCVPYGWITSLASIPWEPVLEAYADSWDLEPRDVADMFTTVELTQAVNRAASWSAFLDEASAAEWQDWGEGPLRHLSRVLVHDMTRMPLDPTPWVFDPAEWPPEDCVAAGADLEPGTLLEAYRRGAFPMPHDGQLLWWSPMRRGVLLASDLRVSRSLARSRRRYEVTIDESFEEVIDACADPSRTGAWIDSAIREAYVRMHRLGWAHSIETRDADGRLVGGLYGLSIGRLFAGESMFHWATDASKVALMGLVEVVGDEGLIDTQWRTDHLGSLGVTEWSRERYLLAIAPLVDAEPPAVWQ